MLDTVARYLANVKDGLTQRALQNVINPMADLCSSVVVSTPGLAIKAGSSAIVKAATAFYGFANGTPVTKAANTDMAALSGTVTNAKFNVFVFYIDSGGNLTSAMGTEGATFSAVVFPTKPVNLATIGFVVINPTGTGNFVGGTTALDDATVVPNAVYVNAIGDWDQTIKLS